MTLVNGQCFNWQPLEAGRWSGVIGGCLVGLKQVDNDVLYMERFPGGTASLDGRLRDYFQLDRFSLAELYARWSKVDPRFNEIAKHIGGVRLLRQDPVECLFSFLCSQNNHISRITGMLAKLREHYGTLLCKDETGQSHYTFPTLSQLLTATEQELRDLGFGYRAKYVVASAELLQKKGGESWLMGLRSKPREEVQQSLLELQGVGRKVADCVALFSLDQLDCIPVDTHVWQIACRDYKKFLPKLHQTTSLTDTVYRVVGDFFRTHFQVHAGWAHSVLFTADLASFRKHLPPDLWTAGKGEKRPKLEQKEGGAETLQLVASKKTKKLVPTDPVKVKMEPDLLTAAELDTVKVKIERKTRLSVDSLIKKETQVLNTQTRRKGETLIKKEATLIRQEVLSKVVRAVSVKKETEIKQPVSQQLKKRKRLSEMSKK